MEERIKDARPMMDLMAKKVFSNTEITAQFIRDILDLPVQTVTILDGTQIHEQQFEDFLTYMTSIDVLAASKISPCGAGEATTVIFLSSTFGAAVVAVSFD